MPVVQVQEAFEAGPLIPKGEHILTLLPVEQRRVKSQFSQEADGKVDKFIFTFRSNQKSEDGDAYKYTVFTGTKYGNEKAALTDLLNQLDPEMDQEKAKGLDLSDYEGTKYETLIRHTKGDDGRVFAKHSYIKPYSARAKAKAKPAVEEDDEADPFGDE
jgi:hypothetical protein